MPWDEPTPRTRELMRQAAEIAIASPDEWVGAVHEATLSAPSTAAIAADPALADAMRRANFDNLFAWASGNGSVGVLPAMGGSVPGAVPARLCRDRPRPALQDEAPSRGPRGNAQRFRGEARWSG